MVKQASILRELQSIVGKKHARRPKNERDCAVDDLSPQAVAEPGSYEEVAEVLRFVNVERLGVIPRGAGWRLRLGNIPSRYDIALSLTRLDKVVEHEPADLTVTCQAGLPVGQLQEQLSLSRQMIPGGRLKYYPETIGGILAGTMSKLPNSPRDFTIGMRIVTGEGRIVKAGGKVVKNVAGYDLCKLFIGSLGTLGVILEATFKLFPIPDVETGLELEFRSIEDIAQFTGELRRSGMLGISMYAQPFERPAFDGHPPFSAFLGAVQIAGSRSAVDRSMREVQAIANSCHARADAGGNIPAQGEGTTTNALRHHPLSCSASVLASEVPTLVHAFEAEPPTPSLDIHPLQGIVTGTWHNVADQAGLHGRLRAAAARLGGTLTVRNCSPDLKRQIDVFGPPPPSFPLMRAVKQQFDPNNVLSPGRFVGRL